MSEITNQKSRATTKKANIKIGDILRRPIVRLAILIVVAIVLVVLIKACMKTNKNEEGLIGYQKMVNVKDNTYTFVDLDGNVKTYEGYTSMNDFYYDVTCVSKANEDGSGPNPMALINKSNKQVVKFGEYSSIIQVIGGKYYKVEKDGNYGVIDYKGKTIIEPEYSYISITTVQEATEVIFECQKDNKYYFISETGKVLMDTDSALHSISYSNKFNSDYDSVIYISVDNVRRYFDLVTGEELFKDIQDVNFSYNVLKTDGKISFYDNKLKLKEEIDVSQDYTSDARVYFKKYVVIEQRNATSGTREYQYTVYDTNFKKVLESTSRIIPVKDIDDNIYFIVNEEDSVKIINENKKETKVEGYEYTGNSIDKLQYLMLTPITSSNKLEAYDFKGHKVIDNISDYTQKGAGLILTKYDSQGVATRTLLLGNKKEIQLTDADEITANKEYLVIENNVDNTVSVVNNDGKVIVEKATGKKAFYAEKYAAIENEGNVAVYSIETGKQTFTYQSADYVNRDETVNIVELTNGLYTFDGKLVVEK